jgi:hypothetical protein
VEGLVLDVQTSKGEPLRTESFENMKYLNLLQINGVRLNGCYRHLPKGIIWLVGMDNFKLDYLVVLEQ